ncbi:MAG: DMT family transporter [Cyanobacteria bacterium Co-bin13]|nr:DMT family transporter [Cyanobacteria bacterium Co-bin13]
MKILRFLKGLLPVLTSLLFAGSFVAGKYTTLDLGPLTTSLLRYLIAAFTLGLLVKYSARPGELKVERRDWLPMVLLGSFGVVGYHYFFFASLSHTAVANTAIINAFNPVVTGLLAAAFIRERLRLRQYGGGAIALLGVLTLLTRGNLLHLLALRLNRGDLLMLCAVFCWAIYALLIKQLSQRHSGLIITFYAALSGVVQLLVLAGLERWWQQLATLSLASFLSLLYMGTAASGLGYLLFNLSVQRIGPTRTASVVYSSVPVFVAGLAWLFFREPVTPIMLLSMGLILMGMNFVLR